MARNIFHRGSGSARKRHFDQNIGERWPSGWWILPSAICGTVFWGVIIMMIL